MEASGVLVGHDRCAAKTRGGGSCKQAAGWGTDHPGAGRCKLHGGSTRNHRNGAAKQLAMAEASRMVARAGISSDPIEHLLDCLHLATALVNVWGSMVAALDDRTAAEANGEVRGELGYRRNTNPESPYSLTVESNDRLLALNRYGEATIHPFVRSYEQALERRAKFAKLCIDAGIAERQVRIAERQGQLIAQAITAIFRRLGIEITPEVADAIGDELRSLTAGEHGDPALN